jgi:hypothetical protein
MLNDAMIGRRIAREVLALRRLLVDAMLDGQEDAAAFDIAVV